MMTLVSIFKYKIGCGTCPFKKIGRFISRICFQTINYKEYRMQRPSIGGSDAEFLQEKEGRLDLVGSNGLRECKPDDLICAKWKNHPDWMMAGYIT